ncbi:MAG: hypothetical protein RBS80_24635 [Thermoguttaceae bacterium]|jgi:hypothetical protein|nr:hypothetical protein [Thermoguttaceae bacterium]
MPENPLTLELLDNRTAYYPGEAMDGIVAWDVPGHVRSIEVHLCWHTEGRGTEDAAVVETVVFDNPQPVDAQPFHLTAPIGPYSYDGRLIAVRWAVEAVAKGVRDLARIEVTISPTRESFVLPSH